MSHTLSPSDRALVTRLAQEAIEVDLGEMNASDEGCVFINYKHESGKWCRVVRTYGRYLVVFRFKPGHRPSDSHPEYQAMFLADDGSLHAFFPKQFEGAGYDKKVYEYLRDHGAKRFNGRNWQKQMAEMMATLAGEWTSPWA